MGYEVVNMEATTRVSRHNDECDAIEGSAWNAFVRDVRALAEHYAPALEIHVSGGDIYYHGKKD